MSASSFFKSFSSHAGSSRSGHGNRSVGSMSILLISIMMLTAGVSPAFAAVDFSYMCKDGKVGTGQATDCGVAATFANFICSTRGGLRAFTCPATLACGPGNHWIDSCGIGIDALTTQATVSIDLDLDMVVDTTVVLNGPTNVERIAVLDDSMHFPGTRPVDGHMDVIDTEVLFMSLTDGTVTLTAGRELGQGDVLPATFGFVAEQVGDPSLSDSIFDVFFEVDLGDGSLAYNHDPLRVSTVLSGVPPYNVVFSNSGPVQLFTDPEPGQGIHIANLIEVGHDSGDPPPPPGPFQEGCWRDTLTSTLIMDLDVGDDGTVEERIEFDQIMEVIRSTPGRNTEGFRTIPIRVLTWDAIGYSEVLGADVALVASPSVQEQPLSYAVAEQQDSDYPATLTFNVIYDVAMGGETVLSELFGTAVGTGMMVIPPVGEDILMVTKSMVMSDPSLRFIPVLCAASAVSESVSYDPCPWIPAVTEWGLVVLTLLILTAAAIVIRRAQALRAQA